MDICGLLETMKLSEVSIPDTSVWSEPETIAWSQKAIERNIVPEFQSDIEGEILEIEGGRFGTLKVGIV